MCFKCIDWKGASAHSITVVLILAISCMALHYSAFFGGWRYDDGAHLYFSLRYEPWQYFFVPDVMREQSWAHFSPWNAFFYEIGLPYFGLKPFGHYVHLLGVLWATSVATFYLLRLWVSPFSALMGAILFLAMPSTGVVAQLLMTGHYAYGLLFSVLVFYFFLRGIRENRNYYSFLAAIFYFLACWSKELYVPIIIMLFFFPEGDFQNRFRHLRPILVVACVYGIYRMVVLHGVGGYGSYSVANVPMTSETITRFLISMLGDGWSWQLIVGYLGISAFFTLIMHTRKVNLLFSLGFCITLAAPIIPIIHSDFAYDGLRFLFFMSWSLAILLVWFSGSGKLSFLALLVVVSILVSSQQITVGKLLVDRLIVMDQEALFLVEKEQESILLPLELENHMLANLNYIQKAAMLFNQGNQKTILQDKLELVELGEEQGAAVYQFDNLCQCMQPLGIEEYRRITDDFQGALRAGSDQQIQVSLEIDGRGFRRRLRWQFSGAEGNFLLKIREYDALPLPAVGEMNFGAVGSLDQLLHVYVQLTSPDGWIVRSPVFEIDPRFDSRINWSSQSVIKLPMH